MVWPGDGGVVCLVVVEARDTDVVVLCERQAGVFVEHQRLNLTNPTKVRIRCTVPPKITLRAREKKLELNIWKSDADNSFVVRVSASFHISSCFFLYRINFFLEDCKVITPFVLLC